MKGWVLYEKQNAVLLKIELEIYDLKPTYTFQLKPLQFCAGKTHCQFNNNGNVFYKDYSPGTRLSHH